MASSGSSLPAFNADITTHDSVIEDAHDALKTAMQQLQPVKDVRQYTVDTLENFTLDCATPLPQFSSQHVTAYKATKTDDSQHYVAYVCSANYTPRLDMMELVREIEHSHILSPLAYGVVRISALQAFRLVMITPYPAGELLSTIADGNRLAEKWVLDQVIRPLALAIIALSEKRASHGCIRPSRVFMVNDYAVLGEGYTTPHGFEQEFLYEPPERMLCEPLGKAEADIRCDIYQLAMMAVDLIIGLGKFRSITKEQLTTLVYENGAFNVFTGTFSINPYLQDFLIGTLHDNVQDRWNAEHLTNWLGGKRFNLVRPSPPKGASRPFSFMERDFMHPRPLLNAMHQNWDTGRDSLRDGAFTRWIHQSLSDEEKAALVQSQISATGGSSGNNAKYNDELLAKTIIVMDAYTPIRFTHLCYHVGAFGLLVRHFFQQNQQDKLQLLLTSLQYDLPSLWMRLNDRAHDSFQDMQWSIDRVRPHLKSTHIGFGIERVLYDLNPDIPCQSSRLEGLYINSARELLYILDAMALDDMGESSLADRHIAAFLTSKMAINRLSIFKTLTPYPKIASNQELQVIMLLAKAQEKERIRHLRSLSHWCARRIVELLHPLHSIYLRQKIVEDLHREAERGNIGQVLNYFVNSKYVQNDCHGFEAAKRSYERNASKIRRHQDQKRIINNCKRYGSYFSYIIAAALLSLSCYHVVQEHVLPRML